MNLDQVSLISYFLEYGLVLPAIIMRMEAEESIQRFAFPMQRDSRTHTDSSVKNISVRVGHPETVRCTYASTSPWDLHLCHSYLRSHDVSSHFQYPRLLLLDRTAAAGP